MTEAGEPIGIIAGAGRFPFAVADAALAQGRGVFLVLLEGSADPALVRYPHAWVKISRFGAILRAFRGAGCQDLVLIGSLVRPPLLGALPDLTAMRLLPKVARLYRGGDDHLLRGVAGMFEAEGFRLIAAQDVAPEILMPEGVLTRRAPDAADVADVAQGLRAIAAIGAFDVGQGIVIGHRRIVAVEGAEGTDGMLERCAAMRASGRLRWPAHTGLLVKAPKPGQDRRLDMPAVGPATIARAAAAGLRGVAVAAGSALMIDGQDMIDAADRSGLFIYGVPGADGSRPDGPGGDNTHA